MMMIVDDDEKRKKIQRLGDGPTARREYRRLMIKRGGIFKPARSPRREEGSSYCRRRVSFHIKWHCATTRNRKQQHNAVLRAK
jgi:hypothetical protein